MLRYFICIRMLQFKMHTVELYNNHAFILLHICLYECLHFGPCHQSNHASASPCSWLDPLVWLGFRKKQLQQEDLFETPKYAISKEMLATFEK